MVVSPFKDTEIEGPKLQDSTSATVSGRVGAMQSNEKGLIVSGGFTGSLAIAGLGFKLAFPDMIIPFGWALSILGLGAAGILATLIFAYRAFFPGSKATRQVSSEEAIAAEPHSQGNEDSAFQVFGFVIKTSPIVLDTGEDVPDLWCVGMFICLGNAKSDSKTLRDVSAEMSWIADKLPLSFEGGAQKTDIRRGEQVLLQVGYTLHSKPIGLPFGASLVVSPAGLEEERRSLEKGEVTFFGGGSESFPRRNLRMADNEDGDLAFRVALYADDVNAVLVDFLINVTWVGKALEGRLLIRPPPPPRIE